MLAETRLIPCWGLVTQNKTYLVFSLISYSLTRGVNELVNDNKFPFRYFAGFIVKLQLYNVVFRCLSNLIEAAEGKNNKISDNSNPARDLGTYRLFCAKLSF